MSIILTVHGESQHPIRASVKSRELFLEPLQITLFVNTFAPTRCRTQIDPKNKTKRKGNHLPMRIQNSRPNGHRKYTSFPLGQKVLRDKSLRWVNRLLKFRMPEPGDIIQSIFCVENTSPCKVM